MTINIEVTTESDVFNSLADSNWKYYFDAYRDTKVDLFLNISEAGLTLSLPFTTSGTEIISSKRSFVGGYVSNISNLREQSRFLSMGLKKLGALGFKRLIHKELPGHFERVQGFSRYPIKSRTIDSFLTLETSIVRISEFRLNSHHARRLRKAKNNLIISHITVPSQIKKHWNYLTDTLQNRGLNFLPVERVEWLIKSFPERFSLFGTQNNFGEPTGTIFVDCVYGVARLANYSASKVPEYAGSIELFADFFLDSVFSNKVNYLDFGTSTDPITGELVDSILSFKRGFNTIEGEVRTRILNL